MHIWNQIYTHAYRTSFPTPLLHCCHELRIVVNQGYWILVIITNNEMASSFRSTASILCRHDPYLASAEATSELFMVITDNALSDHLDFCGK